MSLTRDQARMIVTAHTLAYTRADVLADFELELVQDVYQRVQIGGGLPTAEEMRVIEDARAAMLAAPRQDLTAAGLAA